MDGCEIEYDINKILKIIIHNSYFSYAVIKSDIPNQVKIKIIEYVLDSFKKCIYVKDMIEYIIKKLYENQYAC